MALSLVSPEGGEDPQLSLASFECWEGQMQHGGKRRLWSLCIPAQAHCRHASRVYGLNESLSLPLQNY